MQANCIINTTWRLRHTSWSGGGPAAVLFASEILLGPKFQELDLLYEYQPRGFWSNKNSFEYIKKIRNDPFFVVYYWVAELARYWGRGVFVAHDPVTAAGCALYGVPYILVYHSQGGLLYEHQSQNGRLAEGPLKDALLMAEELAFSKAKKVYFPSLGARTAYAATRSVAIERVAFADTPLYNTAPPFLIEAAPDTELSRPDIYAEVNFLSVGGVTHAKGMDQVPRYLAEFGKASSRKFRWFVFTNGTQPDRQLFLDMVEKYELRDNLVLVDRAVPRGVLLAVMAKCQYYIMSHRHSIFDLATLEAMQAGLLPIPSPVGGNLEVNTHDNVLFLDPDPGGLVERLKNIDLKALSSLNRKIYHDRFGRDAFRASYRAAFQDLVA